MFELQNGNKQEMIIWIYENTQNNEYVRENKLNHINIYISSKHSCRICQAKQQ